MIPAKLQTSQLPVTEFSGDDAQYWQGWQTSPCTTPQSPDKHSKEQKSPVSQSECSLQADTGFSPALAWSVHDSGHEAHVYREVNEPLNSYEANNWSIDQIDHQTRADTTLVKQISQYDTNARYNGCNQL